MSEVHKKIELATNILIIVVALAPGGILTQKYFFGLIRQTQDKNVKITALLPQSREEAGKYRNDSGVSDIEIKQSRLDSLKVGGTPTIIVANDKGEISDV
jgi:hypothetical protein